ncbi:MAG: pyridoxal-phosphate dependent enzyme [Chloroflexi bacterium]|nr:pyridoxal-phosphate dependent enzyme [Chloroflexota bacterium]
MTADHTTSAPPALTCGACGTDPADPLAWRCPECGEPLELPADALNPNDAALSGQGVWRYAPWLPPMIPVSLGEPTTPLVDLAVGGTQVLAKLEAAQPTGSFKDRAAALLVGWLAATGVRHVAEDSSGNAGAALAGYAARAGITCDIYVPATASPGKLTQIAAYGARVIPIDGPRQAAADAAAAAVSAGVVYATHLWNPFCLAGTATWAFEVMEQLGGPPDAVVMPVGAGTLLLGAARAFERLRETGRTDRVPRIYGAQSSGCAPLAEAFARGTADPWKVTPTPSAAEGIMLASPPRGREILRRVRDSGGAIVAVPDDSLWSALGELARLGTYIEPTSAVAPAAVAQLRASGALRDGERVVMALTGSGLKAGDRIRDGLLRA